MICLFYIEVLFMKMLFYFIDVVKQFFNVYCIVYFGYEIDMIDLWSKSIDLLEFDVDMIGVKFVVLCIQNVMLEQYV